MSILNNQNKIKSKNILLPLNTQSTYKLVHCSKILQVNFKRSKLLTKIKIIKLNNIINTFKTKL